MLLALAMHLPLCLLFWLLTVHTDYRLDWHAEQLAHRCRDGSRWSLGLQEFTCLCWEDWYKVTVMDFGNGNPSSGAMLLKWFLWCGYRCVQPSGCMWSRIAVIPLILHTTQVHLMQMCIPLRALQWELTFSISRWAHVPALQMSGSKYTVRYCRGRHGERQQVLSMEAKHVCAWGHEDSMWVTAHGLDLKGVRC